MRRVVIPAVVSAIIGLGMSTGSAPAAAAAVPYSDPAVTGYVGFCDAAGHNVTSGSLDAVPFVAKAVSSAAASAHYSGPGRVAYVEAYQPREGVTPGEWSGEPLISASVYSNPAHPMAVGTKGDTSIGQFVGDFPANWDGFVQVRMYLQAANAPYDPLHYAATDIQVQGNAWHVVRGGTAACSAGTARSLASVLAPSAAAGKYSSTPAAVRSKERVPRSSAPRAAAGSTGNDGSATSSALPPATAGAGGSSGGSFPTGYVVLGTLVAALAGALLVTQRRNLRGRPGRRRGTSASST
jgi:hypothetical protein